MLYITVQLFGKHGVQGEFLDYEKKALDIFRKHGGEVVVAYAPAAGKGGTGLMEIPDEIQVLRIADQNRFDAFLQDPDRVKMAGERDAVIRKTEVYLSERLIDY